MFTILLSDFNDEMKQWVKEICMDLGRIRVLDGDVSVYIASAGKRGEINCFFFNLDVNFAAVSRLIVQLRKKKCYAYTPMFLFSSKMEHLFSAFVRWKNCEIFLVPLSNRKKEILRDLLAFYSMQYERLYELERDAAQKNLQKTETSHHFCISTAKGVYNIPYDDILFIESERKKTLIHTLHGEVALLVPLYRVREILPENLFIQCHRSFIINLKNTAFIDKTKEPWVISFFGTQMHAFVSRSYRKNVMTGVLPFLDDEID